MQRLKIICILFTLLLSVFHLQAQWTGFIKTGLNFGTINVDYWSIPGDTIWYNKPLIRPIFGIGAQWTSSGQWVFRQEVMYQTKGQGTKRPDVRNFFTTSSPDILHFMSFPLSVHKKIFSDFYIGLSIQPSLYLTGSDNYYAKDFWHGWIWGSTLNIHYLFKNVIESGFEYDHDFTSYYCPGCDERFYTYRVYGSYHFTDK